jgi:hypothetical protein
MPALSHRHHGGGGLHPQAHRLPALGYVMIPCRDSNHLGMKHPPDWDGILVPNRGTPRWNVSQEASTRSSRSHEGWIGAVKAAGWTFLSQDRWGPAPPTALQKTVPPLKMPIAPMAGGDLMSVSGPRERGKEARPERGKEARPGLCPGPAKGKALGTDQAVIALGLSSLPPEYP